MEFLVLLLVGKERRLTGISSGGGVLVQRVGHCGEFELLIRIEGGTQCHIEQAVLGAGSGDPQRLIKLLRSTLLKVSGPPRYRILPLMGRPCARPAMVWLTTAL